MPATLGDAIATQSIWLQYWVMVLVGTHLLALVFIVYRSDGKFAVRFEPMAIVLSFVAAGATMSLLYEEVGYVRLLGLPHILFWGPVYAWVATRFLKDAYSFPFKAYVMLYLLIAGISLIIDVSDVIRYLAGDR